MNDPGQKIIQHYELIMKPHEPLNGFEWQPRVGEQAIMKPQEKSLQLGNYSVLVVARIADQCAAGIGIVARQVFGVGIAALDWVTEKK